MTLYLCTTLVHCVVEDPLVTQSKQIHVWIRNEPLCDVTKCNNTAAK